MMETTVEYSANKRRDKKVVYQTHWKYIVMLCILAYEAVGCLLGGSFLIAEPNGKLMDMPVDIMHGVFGDFLIPGIILFGLGILNTAAFITVLRKKSFDWFMAGLGLGGLLIWFWIEIAILEQLHWLHAMWGLPVVMGALIAISYFSSRQTIQKTLLVCGILSSVLYAAINIIVAMQWPEYNSASQTVSELSAVNAPTRMLWLVLSTPYTLFVIAFAWGVWKSAAGNRSLRIAGALLIVYGALGVLWPFAPMHLRETLAAGGGTFSDTMHLTLGAVTEIIYLVALGLAAVSLGKQFKIYSMITFLVLLVFGVLTFMDAPNVSINQPTPLIGVWERINIGVFLLWVIVLAVILLKKEKNSSSSL
jgi:hypothetical protein